MYETIDIEKIAQLVERIGTTLFAHIANSRDQDVATKWLNDVRTNAPTFEQIRNIEFTIECLDKAKSAGVSDYTAYNWLIGRNAASGGVSPAEAIHSGDLRAAEMSLNKLINSTQS
ncbi:MAG: hypothetical protein EOO17_01480 [Chloroflexi bacterium]|nr:MAG: hypothetical protein EOO17_01480 [Chloroflexota bacterium]